MSFFKLPDKTKRLAQAALVAAAGSSIALFSSSAQAQTFPASISNNIGAIQSVCSNPGDCVLGDKTVWNFAYTDISAIYPNFLTETIGELASADGNVFSADFDFQDLTDTSGGTGGLDLQTLFTVDYKIATWDGAAFGPKAINAVGVSLNATTLIPGTSLDKLICAGQTICSSNAASGYIDTISASPLAGEEIALIPPQQVLSIRDVYTPGQGAFIFSGSNSFRQTETPVPGPLPILGAATAFGYSRKLRKRLKNNEVNSLA